MDTLQRMERPEDFWDILYKLADDRILEMTKESQGDVRFSMVDVQSHDVEVYLHQHRQERETFGVLEDDQAGLTKVYLSGLEEAKSRAVFY
jgi:hypothetical protein